jgi:hypothetical protein
VRWAQPQILYARVPRLSLGVVVAVVTAGTTCHIGLCNVLST